MENPGIDPGTSRMQSGILYHLSLFPIALQQHIIC